MSSVTGFRCVQFADLCCDWMTKPHFVVALYGLLCVKPTPKPDHSTMENCLPLLAYSCSSPLRVAYWVFCCPCSCIAHCCVWALATSLLRAEERTRRQYKSVRLPRWQASSDYETNRLKWTVPPRAGNLAGGARRNIQQNRRFIGPVGPTVAQSPAARRSRVPQKGLANVSTVVDSE
jgi:hypothetical protein